MTPPPTATVVVTCFNQEQWIEQALDSVARQTQRDIEVIVTDDGSTDGSRARIVQWLSRSDLRGELVASGRNVGLPAMLNRARPRWQGRYIVVLNGDDWMEPDRVASQSAVLDGAPPSVGLVYSDLCVVDVAGRATGDIIPPVSVERREGHVLLHIISQNMIGMGCVMFRRSLLDVIGGWDESLVADDFDFFLRVAAAGFEFRYLPVVAGSCRHYAGSMTGSRGEELVESAFAALRKLLGRDHETDRAILLRMQGQAMAMHALSYERRSTRRHLWFVMRRDPSRRVGRALVENYMRVRPGSLARLVTPARLGGNGRSSDGGEGP
jgi:glycosyltransferase involved in cell wall biosynthesis